MQLESRVTPVSQPGGAAPASAGGKVTKGQKRKLAIRDGTAGSRLKPMPTINARTRPVGGKELCVADGAYSALMHLRPAATVTLAEFRRMVVAEDGNADSDELKWSSAANVLAREYGVLMTPLGKEITQRKGGVLLYMLREKNRVFMVRVRIEFDTKVVRYHTVVISTIPARGFPLGSISDNGPRDAVQLEKCDLANKQAAIKALRHLFVGDREIKCVTTCNADEVILVA